MKVDRIHIVGSPSGQRWWPTTTRPMAIALFSASASLLVACSSDGTARESAPASVSTAVSTTADSPAVSATNSAPPDTVPTAGPSTLPGFGMIEADTYRVDKFTVPFDITTEGQWKKFYVGPEGLILFRGSTGTDPDVALYVTTGVIKGSTPEEAVGGYCGQTTVAPTAAATLLGQPALQADTVVPGVGCNFGFIESKGQLVIGDTSTVRTVSGVINGTLVTVIAYAPTTDWPTVAGEIDSMTGSMTLVG